MLELIGTLIPICFIAFVAFCYWCHWSIEKDKEKEEQAKAEWLESTRGVWMWKVMLPYHPNHKPMPKAFAIEKGTIEDITEKINSHLPNAISETEMEEHYWENEVNAISAEIDCPYMPGHPIEIAKALKLKKESLDKYWSDKMGYLGEIKITDAHRAMFD